jgi:hypothetical protein
MEQRAEEADQHWHGKVAGLHAGMHLFSFRGLYAALYRTASRPTHASYGAVAEYVDDGVRPVVVQSPAASKPGLVVLAVPLLGMTLAVLASRIQWINEDRVCEIVLEPFLQSRRTLPGLRESELETLSNGLARLTAPPSSAVLRYPAFYVPGPAQVVLSSGPCP